MRQYVFRNCIGSNVPQKFVQFKNTFNLKYEQLKKNVDIEIEECFEDINHEPPKQTNCFLNISKVIRTLHLCLVE